jgi:NAD(P)-dependent dehydrogenase (short-subunit alcohol dehydrogenase family)
MVLSISSVSSVRANLRILGRSGSPVGTEDMAKTEDMANMEVANTKVLVVGGGSGMGFALAKRCLDAGANVIIVGRTEDKLKRAREELQKPAALDTVALDITQEDQVADLFKPVGRLDHIVSTAADIEGAYQLLPLLELKAAQKVVKANFMGRCCWPNMAHPCFPPRAQSPSHPASPPIGHRRAGRSSLLSTRRWKDLSGHLRSNWRPSGSTRSRQAGSTRPSGPSLPATGKTRR